MQLKLFLGESTLKVTGNQNPVWSQVDLSTAANCYGVATYSTRWLLPLNEYALNTNQQGEGLIN